MKYRNNTKHWLGVIATLALIANIFGCTAINTHPLAARPGDTITLAVGSAEGMTAANTTVNFTPNGGTLFPLEIRNIFKIYPDRKSAAWLNNGNTAGIEEQTGHGPWTSIIALDIPLTYPVAMGGGPIEIGHGTINITSGATYSPLTTHIDLIPIGLEILPGTGQKNLFEYVLLDPARNMDKLGNLEPLGGISVKPVYTGTTTGTTYGAIEIVVTIPSSGPISDIKVILDEKVGHTTTRRAQYFWKKSGETITTSIISPDGSLEYYDAHIYIISTGVQAIIDLGYATTGPSGTIVTNTTYYDINGNVVSGPSLVSYDET